MARRDDILNAFLNHPLLKEKYELSEAEQQMTFQLAMNTDIPIVRAIAMVVAEIEDSKPITDKRLYELVVQYLNTSIL